MKNEKIIYGSYTRKSSEAEDRQALSIDSQISELAKLAIKNSIVIADGHSYSESKSAKTAFMRVEFERMISDIEKGFLQAILAWHANRLSRNAIDSARLVELMDKGLLLEIITPGQTFRNTPMDKFLFTLTCSQAKMENDSKGIDVKRGLRKKNELGFPAGVAKPGYTNDYGIKGQRRIIVDLDRFGLVKQLFELFLSGKYSVRKLVRYADQVLGLKSIQRTKEGGKPLALSRLYTVLKDSFYAGFFYGKDENGVLIRYEVSESVDRMITEEQYWQIQTMMGRKGMPRPSINKYDFPYSGRTKCGSCGGGVTAEHKHQLICSECKYKFSYRNKDACPKCETKISAMLDPVYLHYIYYHCTKRRNPDCQEGSVREEIIDNSIAEYIEKNITISKALSEWCIRNLDELVTNDKKNEYERKAAWEKELVQKEKESEELVRMRMKGLITDDTEFLRHKATLEADTQRIKQTLVDMGGTDQAKLSNIKKDFDLVVGVAEIFRNGTFEEKQEALSALGSNLTLKDKKLSVINKDLFQVLEKGLLEARARNKAFEPKICEADKDETEVFASVRPTLLRDQGSNLGHPP